ncbi:MAG: dTDP-4-dehydrorhamnose reductase [Spirochaetales bacterium]|nr:dTDP-4-dehydrorhamnose reductase [Spirochaetales bacterium]
MIWLVGNKGMLGSAVEEIISRCGFEYVSTDKEVDITSMAGLESYISGRRFPDIDYIINCAAYTAVDSAERERDKAFRLNASGPRHLALIARRRRAVLIHISTDYVFDGEKEAPYIETDPAHPLCVYGASKLEGEKLLQSETDRFFILRTAWLYGRGAGDFVKTMIGLFNEREAVTIVDDRTGSPTNVKDLAEAIVTIIKIKTDSYGIYHVTNQGYTTWFGFATEIYRYGKENGVLTRDVSLLPITSYEYQAPAKRPKNSVLSNGKCENRLGIVLRPWREALCDYLESEKSRIFSM